MSNLNQYFAAKKNLYTQGVKGRFRRIKSILNVFFLSIYLFTPVLRFDRGENVPNQAVLIDIPNSKAYFFFIEIWPQEVYYLAGILIAAAIMLFFATSLFGRIWCGYACFQTVWCDIFAVLERFFQGDRNQRILLDRKNSFKKFYKKILTHCSWILVSIITGYAFACYFNDSILVTKSLVSGEISSSILGWVLGVALATYIMAGFAREHVCTYMCPYSRFQSAMFDKNTLIITYDEKRGEPRGKLNKSGEKKTGDCIDCKQCVVVCPTGIDIRNGLQMECIACGLCIDACDNMMTKVGLPKGLIRYDTLSHLLDPQPKNKFKVLRPRTFLYAAVLMVVASLVLSGLIFRSKLEISITPDRNPLFVTLSDGAIRNGYLLKIMNKTHEKKNFNLKITNPAEARLVIQSFEANDSNHFEVAADSVGSFKIFSILPKETIEKSEDGRGLIEFIVSDQNDVKERKKIEAVFIGK